MDKNHDNADLFPPLVPAGEVSRDESGFTKNCQELFNKNYPVDKAALGKPIVTYEPQWGQVLRADFAIDGRMEPGFLNRFICWKNNSGQIEVVFAIGQHVSPLADSN